MHAHSTLPSVHILSERQGQQDINEVEKVLQIIERSLTTSSRRVGAKHECDAQYRTVQRHQGGDSGILLLLMTD